MKYENKYNFSENIKNLFLYALLIIYQYQNSDILKVNLNLS